MCAGCHRFMTYGLWIGKDHWTRQGRHSSGTALVFNTRVALDRFLYQRPSDRFRRQLSCKSQVISFVNHTSASKLTGILWLWSLSLISHLFHVLISWSYYWAFPLVWFFRDDQYMFIGCSMIMLWYVDFLQMHWYLLNTVVTLALYTAFK